VDYDTAEKNCETLDIGTGSELKGNLATVNDAEKNTDLKLLLAMAYEDNEDDPWGNEQWVWAGLRKTKNNDGSKKNRKYNPDDWAWADGSHPTEFRKWLPRQPDQKSKGGELQNQMRINHDGRWDDTYKYKTHPYACDYQGKYILSATPKSWSQAKVACEKAGLMLAKVRSDAEVEEMKKAAEYFIGPRDKTKKLFDSSNWLWLGGNDAAEEGKWTWVDGSPIEYFDNMNWRPPNPDNAAFMRKLTQNYLSISKWGEFDDSFDSKRKLRPFACQCPGS